MTTAVTVSEWAREIRQAWHSASWGWEMFRNMLVGLVLIILALIGHAYYEHHKFDPADWIRWLRMPTPAASAQVAVLDTGVDYTHPDLKGRIVNGRDLVNGDTDPWDDNGHGTASALWVASAVPGDAKIVAIKVLGAKGLGGGVGVAEGILEAVMLHHVRVIYSGADLSEGHLATDPFLRDAIGYARSQGVKIMLCNGEGSWELPH
jgi:hypothetical protein